MFGLDSPLVIIAVVSVLAYFVGKWLFSFDEKVEDRRRHAAQIATELKQEGLQHIPDLLIDYSVGDYSGMVSRMKMWYEFLRDDDQRKAFFSKFLETQLKNALNDPNRRQKLLDHVEEWKAGQEAKKKAV